MKKLLAKLWASICKRLGWEKEPEPSGPVDALDLNTVDWLGSNYSGAPITTMLRSARLDNRLHYDFDLPESWSYRVLNGKKCYAILAVFYELEGKVVGGKLDHSKKEQTSQDLKNTRNGYHGHKPIPGASKVWMCVVDEDEAERSNVVEVTR